MMFRNSKPEQLGIPGIHMIGTERIFHLGYARRELGYLGTVKKTDQFIEGCTGIWNFPVMKCLIWGRTQILSEWW